ncbi:hypothetical protein [Pararhizobium qamdonense]|uniref:hypothetical protein n=1 Tax=Pararhizobium qamdonense TaxID=3031126 RepID=UPI0023E1B437|nr:hypothetical protein [Pararhizobium qamdonense]
MEPNELWKGLKLDPELQPFILLSGADVSELTELAMCADKPADWLIEELHKRARKKRDLKAFYKTKRMKQDADRISNPSSWPVSRLPLKTQPWQNEDGKSMRFAHGYNKDYLIVHTVEGKTIVYDTIEELVEMWSVD